MLNKQEINIWACDFWVGFDFKNTTLFDILVDYYDVRFDKDNPNILFYSVFGKEHNKYKCKKIQISEECPNKTDEDDNYYIGYRKDDNPKHLYALWQFLGKTDFFTQCILQGNLFNRGSNEIKDRKFCAFLVSNWKNTCPTLQTVKGVDERIRLFQYLTQYKRVDSGGAVYNNLGHLLPRKVDAMNEFYSTHKYAIAYENLSYPGYLTEKIFIPLAYGCIPIYYGDTEVESIINPDCFINATHLSHQDTLEKIKEIENNSDLYHKMITAPVFIDDTYLDKMITNLLEFIQKIVQE